MTGKYAPENYDGSELYPHHASAHCEKCGRYFEYTLCGALDEVQHYCSTRCAREYSRQNRISEYLNRDQLDIFTVEGV
jgi:hypothetical protein